MVKLMIAIAIFLTYSLQFYVPMEIIWKNIKGNFNEHQNAAEYTLRIGLVVSCCSDSTLRQIHSLSLSFAHRS